MRITSAYMDCGCWYDAVTQQGATCHKHAGESPAMLLTQGETKILDWVNDTLRPADA